MLTQNTATMVLEASALNDALRRVKHAISTEKTRYYLQGVYVHAHEGKARLAATDGHRLACVTVEPWQTSETTPLDSLPTVILPREFVLAAIKATNKSAHARRPVTLSWSTADMPLTLRGPIGSPSLNDSPLEAKPIDDTYPDYLRVVPRGETATVRVDRADFMAAVSCVTAFAAAQNEKGVVNRDAAVRLTLAGNSVTVDAKRQIGDHDCSAAAHCNAEIAADEPGLQIVFRGRYLVDILESLEGGTVSLKITDPGSPTTVIGDDMCDAHAFHVLMPCRV